MAESARRGIQVRVREGIATVILDRPDRHNAFDDALIAELTQAFERLAREPAVRVVMLAAAGRSFSAGADLEWMRRAAGLSTTENVADARRLAAMLDRLDRLPKPTVALVQGPAIGGGVGLVATCDLAVAATEATFALSEVRLGLVPAVIAPYVMRAIGARAARRYMLTAERFDAAEAHRLGLVHMVVEREELGVAGRRLADALIANGPNALAAAKEVIAEVAAGEADEGLRERLARRIAELRAAPEGREGIAAFLEKRAPSWAPSEERDVRRRPDREPG